MDVEILLAASCQKRPPIGLNTFNDPSKRLVAAVDVVVIAVPGGTDTQHLSTRMFWRRLAPHAI